MNATPRELTPTDTMTHTMTAETHRGTPGTVFAALADPATHVDIHGKWASDHLPGQVGRAEDTNGQQGPSSGRTAIRGDGAVPRAAPEHELRDRERNCCIRADVGDRVAHRTLDDDDGGGVRFGRWPWRCGLAATGTSTTDVPYLRRPAATTQARHIINSPPFGPDHLHR